MSRANSPNRNMDDLIKLMFQRMEELTVTVNTLAAANENRVREVERVVKLLHKTPTIITDDESPANGTRVRPITEVGDRSRPRPRSGAPAPAESDDDYTPRGTPQSNPNGCKAVEALHMIQPLRGKDDCGVEEFIRSIRFAKINCREPEILLQMVKVEKIIDHAERNIRFSPMATYEELFETLRRQVQTPQTVSGSRRHLQSIRQGPTENVQSYSLRFKQGLSELKYAIQAKHIGIARRIALEEEEEEAVRTFCLNLKREIGQLVVPSKPKSLQEAQEEAIDRELWIRDAYRMHQRYDERPPLKSHYSRPPTARPGQPQQRTFGQLSNMPLSERSRMKCGNCGKIGHTRENCYQLRNHQNFHGGQTGKIPPRVHNTTSTQQESATHQENSNILEHDSTGCEKEENYCWIPEPEQI